MQSQKPTLQAAERFMRVVEPVRAREVLGRERVPAHHRAELEHLIPPLAPALGMGYCRMLQDTRPAVIPLDLDPLFCANITVFKGD